MKDKERNDLVKYRLARVKNTLKEVDLLVENRLWNAAMSRLYYACYYAVLSVLINSEIRTRTHAGVRQMFGLHYIKSGKLKAEYGPFYSELFDLRLSGDYDDYFDCTKEDVIDVLGTAKDLINDIEVLLKDYKT